MSADLLSSAFATFFRHRMAPSSSTITSPSLPTSNVPPLPVTTSISEIHRSTPTPSPYTCQPQHPSLPLDKVNNPSTHISPAVSSQPPLKRFRYTPSIHFSDTGFSSPESSPLISPISIISPPLNIPTTKNFDSSVSSRLEPSAPPNSIFPARSNHTIQASQFCPSASNPNMDRIASSGHHVTNNCSENNDKSESSMLFSSLSVSPQTAVSLPGGVSTVMKCPTQFIPTETMHYLPSTSPNLPPESPISCSTGISKKKRALEPCNLLQVTQGQTYGSNQLTNDLAPIAKHQCPYCAVLFHSEENLNEHKRKHERPFACSTPGCVASFSKANHLSRHIRIVHNKERPFACTQPGCGARFGSKSHLGDHTRAVHMRLRNFKCTMCDASWSKRFNLEKHIRIRHLGEKPFRCSFCYMSFGTRSHVTRHELKVHKRTQAQQT